MDKTIPMANPNCLFLVRIDEKKYVAKKKINSSIRMMALEKGSTLNKI